MDALAGLSDADDSETASSGSEAEEGGKAAAAAAPAAKRAKQQIDLETLKQHGYKGGPSVLFVPDKQDDAQQNWAWCVRPALAGCPPGAPASLAPPHPAVMACRGSGTTHRGEEEQEETFEERELNREAVTLRAEESGERPCRRRAPVAARRPAFGSRVRPSALHCTYHNRALVFRSGVCAQGGRAGGAAASAEAGGAAAAEAGQEVQLEPKGGDWFACRASIGLDSMLPWPGKSCCACCTLARCALFASQRAVAGIPGCLPAAGEA